MSNDLEEVKVSVPDTQNNRKIKIGSFLVKDSMIEDDILAEALSEMKFVPVKCELRYGGMFEMIGFSHMFEEIEFGLQAPEYTINIAVKDNVFDHVQVEKV